MRYYFDLIYNQKIESRISLVSVSCRLVGTVSLKRLFMLELIKSLGFALMMVPVVMFLIMGLIYGLGAFFNLLSKAHVQHHHNTENK